MTTATTQVSKSRSFQWLLRREFWEHRGGFLWAPVITGSIVVVLYTLLAVIGSIAGHNKTSGMHFNSPGHEFNATVGAFGDGVLLTGVLLACIVLAFVVFFYCLGSLYDDRRDRSVLFWKSLPLSDTQTVLSKAAWALLLGPVMALTIGLVIGVALWLVTSLTLSVNGVPSGMAVFTHSHPLRLIGGILSCLPVYIAWSLPTIGWLMFCSAWARSKPFLWAVLLPLLACVIISMMDILPMLEIPHAKLWYVVVFRGLLSMVPGAWYASLPDPSGSDITQIGVLASMQPVNTSLPQDLSRGWQVFQHADIWIGAVIGIAFIAAAVFMRRWRDEN